MFKTAVMLCVALLVASPVFSGSTEDTLDICVEQCAAECAKHTDDKTCQTCAKQYRQCAVECREMANKSS